MDDGSRRRAPDAIVYVLLALVAVVAVFAASRDVRPDEDAAMLMRYAVTFADGHGVAYNAEGPAVDGATDLLVVPMAAGLVAAGVSAVDAVLVLDALALVATVLLLHRFGRSVGGPWWIVAVPLFVLTGRALGYVHLGYATPVFGLAVLALWMLVERCRRDGPGSPWGHAMVAVGVVAFLVRPEGLAFLAMAFVSLSISRPGGGRDLLRPLAVAGALLAVVLAARWAYFGYPLPNPYYVKGDGSLYLSSLFFAVAWTVLLAWPAIAVLAVGVVVPTTRRLALAQAVPLAGVTGMWLLLSNATNRDGRFQYAGSLLAYVGALVVLPRLLSALSTSAPLRAPRRRTLAARGIAALALLGLALQVVTLAPELARQPPTPHDGIGHALAGFDPQGRVMVTTEAGIIPLRSGWRSVDAYGLNDAAIAHAGGIDEARLRRERPDVIVIHGDRTTAAGWGPMVGQLLDYAAAHDYRQAVPYDGGSTFLRVDQWYVYVRADAADAEPIVAAVRASLAAYSF